MSRVSHSYLYEGAKRNRLDPLRETANQRTSDESREASFESPHGDCSITTPFKIEYTLAEHTSSIILRPAIEASRHEAVNETCIATLSILYGSRTPLRNLQIPKNFTRQMEDKLGVRSGDISSDLPRSPQVLGLEMSRVCADCRRILQVRFDLQLRSRKISAPPRSIAK